MAVCKELLTFCPRKLRAASTNKFQSDLSYVPPSPTPPPSPHPSPSPSLPKAVARKRQLNSLFSHVGEEGYEEGFILHSLPSPGHRTVHTRPVHLQLRGTNVHVHHEVIFFSFLFVLEVEQRTSVSEVPILA